MVKSYLLFSYYVNRVKNQLRIYHFRMIGVKIGKNCDVGECVLLLGNVSIGDNCSIGSNTYIGTFGGTVIIEDNCHIGNMNQIGSSGARVRIGQNCLFAPYVMITDATHSFKDSGLIIKDSPIISKNVDIGCNVWLGSSAMVMPGVSIKDGAVIGAKALVNKNIPADAIAFGCPAKVIYFRDKKSE